MMKRCTGPAHPEPTLVPVDRDHWNFHMSGPQAGSPVARCKQCVNWAKIKKRDGAHGWVEAETVRPFMVELVERCGGYRATVRRYRIHEETLRQVILGNRANVQKRTAGLVLASLSLQRKRDRQNGASRPFLDGRKHRARMEKELENYASTTTTPSSKARQEVEA